MEWIRITSRYSSSHTNYEIEIIKPDGGDYMQAEVEIPSSESDAEATPSRRELDDHNTKTMSSNKTSR